MTIRNLNYRDHLKCQPLERITGYALKFCCKVRSLFCATSVFVALDKF